MATVNTKPPVLTKQDIARFWSYVDKSPGQGPQGKCWRWTKGTVGKYGSFGTFTGGEKRNLYAHRLAFFLATGRWPVFFVCHKCDWTLCCNPDDLFEGTQADNLHDMSIKGRSSRGEKQGRSKLTAPQILEIRALVAAGAKQRDIAARFGITAANVNVIVKRRRSWLHV